MSIKKYLYSFGYDNTESDLCKLESRHIFNREERNRLLFSDVKAEPSSSAFIKNRLDIISVSTDYLALISAIKEERIVIEGFKVEYIVLDGDSTDYVDRLDKLRDIGYRITGFPDYHSPTVTYALCNYEGNWLFGKLIKNGFYWQKHKDKPRSYSNSISMNVAKALVNIAAKANKGARLLDACCGVGTIMLEACFAGYTIDGCDINWKISKDARENLAYFGYLADVFRSDVKDISTNYDAAIIDLPYNLLSTATHKDILYIMASTAEITDRLVIVSTSDISSLIRNIGFMTTDKCNVRKRGKTNFVRRVWVCDREANGASRSSLCAMHTINL